MFSIEVPADDAGQSDLLELVNSRGFGWTKKDIKSARNLLDAQGIDGDKAILYHDVRGLDTFDPLILGKIRAGAGLIVEGLAVPGDLSSSSLRELVNLHHVLAEALELLAQATDDYNTTSPKVTL